MYCMFFTCFGEMLVGFPGVLALLGQSFLLGP